MFLHFLTEDFEKEFFLNFAYLLAVAEKEKSTANIPIHASEDDPEKNEYAFEEFAPGFSMQINELLMLRKFAEEMSIEFDTVSSEYVGVWSLFGRETVAAQLEKLVNQTTATQNRSDILQSVFTKITEKTNPATFHIAKRKAILIEATAIAYADGNISEYEEELLLWFCKLCRLDTELLEEFKKITIEFSHIYSNCLELITE